MDLFESMNLALLPHVCFASLFKKEQLWSTWAHSVMVLYWLPSYSDIGLNRADMLGDIET
jgi:hypothetical protein